MVESRKNVNKADKKKSKQSNNDNDGDDAELPTSKRAKKAKADDLPSSNWEKPRSSGFCNH